MLDADRQIRRGAVKQRSVLALLLLHVGEVVSADILVDELWGEAPPDDAAAALQQHVSRLRRARAARGAAHTRAGLRRAARRRHAGPARVRAALRRGYAAQAAQVVLDAIARYDGTRSSIVDELFRTRVRHGLLGDFSFDRRGDITESPITIMRAARGGSSRRIASVEGGVVERVSRPRAALVAGRR